MLGPSGCGKSTLLDLLSLIARPDEVQRFDFAPRAEPPVELHTALAGHGKSPVRLTHLRKHHLGYILQTGGLLPFLSVFRNIRLCQELTGRIDTAWLMELGAHLGIERHFNKLPATLSTGERQRVAVARALAHSPAVVIADEPTAALDPQNADNVLALLVSLTKKLDATLLLATHDAGRLEKHDFRRLSQRFADSGNPQTVVSIFENEEG